MQKWTHIIFILLLMDICFVQSKRGGSSSWSGRGSSSSSGRGSSSSSGRGGSSYNTRGSSSHGSGSSKPQSGWFSSSSKPSSSATATKPASSYGFQKPAPKPVSSPASGWGQAQKPASGSSYGWQRPGDAPKPSHSSGWVSSNNKPATNPISTSGSSAQSWPKPADVKPASGSTYGWQRPGEVAKPVQNTGGWGTSNYKPVTNNAAVNKPVSNVGQGTSAYNWPKSTELKPAGGSTYGWQKPPETVKPLQNSGSWGTTNNKPVSNVASGSYPVQQGLQKSPSPAVLSPPHNTAKIGTSNQPSSNLGSGGYPVQQGVQKLPSSGSHSSPHSSNIHGTSYNTGSSNVAPPVQTTSYNGPKKQIINNHYHYGSPAPSYTPSHYGMSSSYYPQQNNFGYPGGFYGNSQPSYGGLGLFSSGMGNYGYSGGGNWGGYRSYGSSSSGIGSATTGLLIGAAGGYLASSLVNRLSNPWNYQGHGYGYNYHDRYRYDDQYRYHAPPPTTTTTTTTPAPPPYDPTKDWINCVAYNPETKETLINPNCTCSVTVVTDPMTGQNTSHHDCTPYAQGNRPPFVPQQPLPVYGVNNPPPSFNGNLYGSGSSYGGGYPAGPTGTNPAYGAAVPFNGQQISSNPNINPVSLGLAPDQLVNPGTNPVLVPSGLAPDQLVNPGTNPVPAPTGLAPDQLVNPGTNPVPAPTGLAPDQLVNPGTNPVHGTLVSSGGVAGPTINSGVAPVEVPQSTLLQETPLTSQNQDPSVNPLAGSIFPQTQVMSQTESPQGPEVLSSTTQASDLLLSPSTSSSAPS